MKRVEKRGGPDADTSSCVLLRIPVFPMFDYELPETDETYQIAYCENVQDSLRLKHEFLQCVNTLTHDINLWSWVTPDRSVRKILASW